MTTACEIIYTQEDLSRNDIVAGMHNSGQNHWVLIVCLNSLVIYCLFKFFLYIHSTAYSSYTKEILLLRSFGTFTVYPQHFCISEVSS